MPIAKEHFYRTEGDGVLDAKVTGPADLRALARAAVSSPHVVLHLHGGLVSGANALEKAERLEPVYRVAGCHAVFPIWETGFLETLGNNFREIAREKIFEILSKKILSWAMGKLAEAAGIKAATGLRLPNDLELAIELQKRNASELDPAAPAPYSSEPITRPSELSPDEQKLFEQRLAADPAFQQEVNAIVNGATAPSGAKTAAGQRSERTKMSNDIVDELVAERAKGAIEALKLAKHAGAILFRVVSRFRQRRDHGIWATVVEEILRELYLAAAGNLLWSTIKRDARDAFENVGMTPERGGWLFVKELGAAMRDTGARPRVSIVGHSAGSIYACHLLAHLSAARATGTLPADFAVTNLVFLAPAVDHALFAATLRSHRSTFDRFRMYSMSDTLESGYWEIPVLYPRSLLYLVSGVAEQAVDHPIVGMQRYLAGAGAADDPFAGDEDVGVVRQFLAEDARRTVWAETALDVGPGAASDAIKHGEFDATAMRDKTMRSVVHLLGES